MSTTLLVEAKREYTEQLVIFLTDAMYDEFNVLWKDCVDKSEPMLSFQGRLEEIVDWDEKTMIQRTDSCISKSGCNFIDDLITAVFVAHMKTLMTIKNSNNKDKYRLQIPTANKFVYECLVQCSRELWKSPYLFYQNELENRQIKRTQMQKNLREVEQLIVDSIKKTIRSMLPVKEIVGDAIEYDADGDLVLDVQTSKKVQEKVKESPPSPTPTPAKKEDGNEEGVLEEVDVDIKDTPDTPPVKDESGSGGKEVTKDDMGEDEDLITSTIENIRTSVKATGEDFEYEPYTNGETTTEESKVDVIEKPSKSITETEPKTEDNGGDEDDDEDEWKKGFVLGPVETDMKVEAEEIKEDDFELDGVVELS